MWEAVRREPKRVQGRPGGPAGREDVSRGSGEREQVPLAEQWDFAVVVTLAEVLELVPGLLVSAVGRNKSLGRPLSRS